MLFTALDLYYAGFGPGLSCMIYHADTCMRMLNTRLYQTETVCGLLEVLRAGKEDETIAKLQRSP